MTGFALWTGLMRIGLFHKKQLCNTSQHFTMKPWFLTRHLFPTIWARRDGSKIRQSLHCHETGCWTSPTVMGGAYGEKVWDSVTAHADWKAGLLKDILNVLEPQRLWSGGWCQNFPRTWAARLIQILFGWLTLQDRYNLKEFQRHGEAASVNLEAVVKERKREAGEVSTRTLSEHGWIRTLWIVSTSCKCRELGDTHHLHTVVLL